MPDPATIAASLSEAQRRAILAAEPKLDGDPESLFINPRVTSFRTAEALCDAGLAIIVMRGVMLNERGLAVRSRSQGDKG